MKFEFIEQYRHMPIIIWGHPKGTHTHSWIHFRFFRAFSWLGFDVQWLDNNILNLPDKDKPYIIITENGVDDILHQNYSDKWIIFDHNIGLEKYNRYSMASKNIIPFDVVRYNLAKFTKKTLNQYISEFDTPIMSTEDYYFRQRNPKILWGSELLPHEMQRVAHGYKNNSKDVVFVGSRWHNNFVQLETLRAYCWYNGLSYKHFGRHLFFRPPLFQKKYLSPEELENVTKNAYISPALQGVQVDDGYIPCRLFIQMSLSVLAVSNNPYVYNIFNDDEVVVDRNIWQMMDKAQRIIFDKKVDSYTKKAFDKVKYNHTYLNRINELFSYL